VLYGCLQSGVLCNKITHISHANLVKRNVFIKGIYGKLDCKCFTLNRAVIFHKRRRVCSCNRLHEMSWTNIKFVIICAIWCSTDIIRLNLESRARQKYSLVTNKHYCDPRNRMLFPLFLVTKGIMKFTTKEFSPGGTR
jgi:hypothetical protein